MRQETGAAQLAGWLQLVIGAIVLSGARRILQLA